MAKKNICLSGMHHLDIILEGKKSITVKKRLITNMNI